MLRCEVSFNVTCVNCTEMSFTLCRRSADNQRSQTIMDTIVHTAATNEVDQQYHLQSEMAEAQSHIFRIFPIDPLPALA